MLSSVKATGADKPYFDFQYLNRKNIKNIEKQDWEQFTKKLRVLKEIKWNEININSRKETGYESIPTKQAKTSINPFDRDKIDVFRFSPKGRFLGYRKEDSFYIVEIDPKHKAYKT